MAKRKTAILERLEVLAIEYVITSEEESDRLWRELWRLVRDSTNWPKMKRVEFGWPGQGKLLLASEFFGDPWTDFRAIRPRARKLMLFGDTRVPRFYVVDWTEELLDLKTLDLDMAVLPWPGWQWIYNFYRHTSTPHLLRLQGTRVDGQRQNTPP